MPGQRRRWDFFLHRCCRGCSRTSWFGLMPWLHCWRRLDFVTSRILRDCINAWRWIGIPECISNVDEGVRLMGSVCSSEHVCSSICSPCTCSQITSVLISPQRCTAAGRLLEGTCLVIHNGEHCKRETGSPRDVLNCLLRNPFRISSVLTFACISSCILIALHKDRTSLECKYCLWWNWWNACGFVSVRE